MANYDVIITNGSGSEAMKKGNYNVTVAATGYDATTLLPKTFTATDEGAIGTFTLSATGVLTFVVNETGAEGGTPITSGTIVMTDSTGSTEYGDAVVINSSGNAVFNEIPFGTSEEPITLYFKQLTTDSGHNIYTDIITVSVSASTQTVYIKNTPIAVQNFTLTHARYSGLPINATLTFMSIQIENYDIL